MSHNDEPPHDPGTVLHALVEYVGGPFDGVVEIRQWSELRDEMAPNALPGFEIKAVPSTKRTSDAILEGIRTGALRPMGSYRRAPNQTIGYVAIAQSELRGPDRQAVIERETEGLEPLIMKWERA